MKRFQRKLVASGIIGNLLDGYDTCIFGYMAFYIASYFFVSPDTLNDLLKTFIIFTLSYLVRPIGGLVFGLIGDYVGRKKAFVSSLLLMGTSTTLIGILPGFNAIGMLAIWLLLLLRILQSFGAGAEYTNSIVFLYEHAPEKQATFMTSFAAFGINLGFFCAAIIGSFVAALMQAHILGDWGWRLPFLIAIFGTLFGLILRQTIGKSVPETIPFIMNNALKPRDFKQFFAQLFHDARQNYMNYLTLIAVIWLGTASTYLLYIYFPIHLSTIRHIPYSQSLIINTVSIALLVICIPVFSYFSDRWERRKVILLATVGYLVLALPYYLILSYGNLTAIFIAQLTSAFISALFYGMAPAIIAESAPPTIRCTMTSVIYGIASSIFGGSAPIVALTLIKYTGLSIAPAFYLLFSAGFCLLMLATSKRTMPTRPHLAE